MICRALWVATRNYACDGAEFVNKFVHRITTHYALRVTAIVFWLQRVWANQIRLSPRDGIMVSGKPCLWDNSPTWVRQIANHGKTDTWRQYVDVMMSNSMEQTNYVVDAG
jgi:hypothetical protein